MLETALSGSSERTASLSAHHLAQGTQPPIERSSILVVAKRSRYERDQLELGLSEDDLLTRYEAMGESGTRVLGSHERQRHAKEICAHELSLQQVIQIEELPTRLSTRHVGAVIALGGDDFLKLVSQQINDTPVLGVNSDPSTSSGFLLSTQIAALPTAIRALEAGCYRIERWARAHLVIDGHDYGVALNDVVLGNRDFRSMSRHELTLHGETVQQRCSGILIASGTGSTGWFSSAGLYLGDHDRTFARTAQELRFVLREPQATVTGEKGFRSLSLPRHCQGTVLPGEFLRITSLNSGDGIASRDSLDEIPFLRGSMAEVSVSENPLSMIIPEALN